MVRRKRDMPHTTRKWRNVEPSDVDNVREHLEWLRGRYATAVGVRKSREEDLAEFERAERDQPVRQVARRNALATRLYASRKLCAQLLQAIARFENAK